MSKKIGYFFYSFLPFLLVLVIEYAATLFLMGILALVELMVYRGSINISFEELVNDWFHQMTSVGFSTYTMVIYSLISICTFGLWYYLQFRGRLRPNFKENFSPLMVVGLVFLTPGAQYVCSYLVSFMAAIFPSWMETYEKLMETAGMDDKLTIGMFFYSVMLAPFCEELLCRGVILSSAKRAVPFWAANLLQAFLFGFLHMNMIQGTYAFCLGLILGLICEKSGSIYYSILLHVLFNFWGTVIGPLLNFGDSNAAFLISAVIVLILLVLGVVFFITGLQKRDERNAILHAHNS